MMKFVSNSNDTILFFWADVEFIEHLDEGDYWELIQINRNHNRNDSILLSADVIRKFFGEEGLRHLFKISKGKQDD